MPAWRGADREEPSGAPTGGWVKEKARGLRDALDVTEAADEVCGDFTVF